MGLCGAVAARHLPHFVIRRASKRIARFAHPATALTISRRSARFGAPVRRPQLPSLSPYPRPFSRANASVVTRSPMQTVLPFSLDI
jgi:hypothetical protein